MGVGISDGTFFSDDAEHVASTHSTMPLQGPTEPAGEFKSSGDTRVPVYTSDPESEPDDKGFFGRLSIVNPLSAMAKGPNLEEDKRLLTGLWESAKNAFKLPGDVSQGNIDPSSPMAVERAFDLAGFMVFGPMPVAGKMADGTLGSFAGVKSKTFDRNNLAMAQIQESQGLHSDDVFRNTGMFRGIDGRWRYEISDKNAAIDESSLRLIPQEQYSIAHLEDFYKHPELYKAYPELKGAQIVEDLNYPGVAVAHEDHIRYNPENIKKAGYTLKEVVAHEVQHKIQSIEGFAKGGAPWTISETGEGPYKLAFQINPEKLQKIKEGVAKTVEAVSKGKKLTEEQLDNLAYLNKVLDTHGKYIEAANQQAYEYYARLAGEVEARNVQSRSNHFLDMVPPRLTEDVLPHQQIITQQPVGATAYGITDPSGRYIKP